jgi:UDP-N-acetylglucosamine:LPS N-acetylglucosamine transferase
MNDEKVALRFAQSLKRHGYKVWVIKSAQNEEVRIGAQKGGRKSVIRFEHYDGKGDLGYMAAVAKALDSGRVTNSYLITDDTHRNDSIHRFTIHFPE